MMFNRLDIISQLQQASQYNLPLIGVAAGSGLTAKSAQKGGADFILALSSGFFRQKGISSLAGYMPISNSNQVVMDFAKKEILPAMRIPTFFGFNATDPTLYPDTLINKIKSHGFSGIINYPTIGLIDGHFREALEESGFTYQREIDAIKIAHEKDLFTIAFVFSQEQGIKMIEAGADIICIHLGLTTGGLLGGHQFKSLQSAKRLAVRISHTCRELNPDILTMVYGGPFNKPVDIQFMYDGTDIDGYIGGSAFERIPAEEIIENVTRSFKTMNDHQYKKVIQQTVNDIGAREDYIDFIIKYVSAHYHENLSLNDFASMVNLSRSYLSTLFKEKMGISFTDYLIDYRLSRAIEIMKKNNFPLKNIAEMVGYTDYAQFSRIFKKRKGQSPRAFFTQQNDA
ncbi:uncharacterized protein JNUCC1_00736 [Lentibacillus sp. JNUCC-1]|uniref:phosphoenolpyruvate hydrolase family protein n=1 Tax=Lentibacillus sp. JNUCC-1 TaxID=2654513 RepID=UPI001327C542|nr:phosphoenolpyruvate hydrolase family protein [Lentibacillus sp. JNUCC-1]MUV36932.1 uncharacterized protein [Lentibacillus sp. JNUCC-1]